MTSFISVVAFSGGLDPRLGLVIGLAFVALLAVVFWPGRGVLNRMQRSRGIRGRVLAEDALKHIFKTEGEGRRPTVQSIAGALQVTLNGAAEVIEGLRERELVELPQSEIRLTPQGRRYALNIIRAHRLWEQHLAEQTGVGSQEWHRQAEYQEHFISPEQANHLAARLGHPTHDPHGDPIPTADGVVIDPPAHTVASIAPGTVARIVHVEDEPEAVFAQITAAGLFPGMTVRVLENGRSRVRLWADGEEHVLAPVVASNISVRPLPRTETPTVESGRALSSLQPGDRARVTRLSPQCRGAERRRLMDLGLLPGTTVVAEMRSPAGNLTAYRVRDALLALRREQSELVHVEDATASPASP